MHKVSITKYACFNLGTFTHNIDQPTMAQLQYVWVFFNLIQDISLITSFECWSAAGRTIQALSVKWGIMAFSSL